LSGKNSEKVPKGEFGFNLCFFILSLTPIISNLKNKNNDPSERLLILGEKRKRRPPGLCENNAAALQDTTEGFCGDEKF
jgi:hypothetical protein